MSVGHSRRTRRRPSATASGRGGERLLEVALDAVLLEAGGLAHLVLDVGEHLEQPDLEPVLAAAGALADDEQLAVLLEHDGRRHPVQRLEATGVGMDEHRAVGLDHHEPRRLGQEGGQPAGVGDLAAGDDQAHAGTVLSLSDMQAAGTRTGHSSWPWQRSSPRLRSLRADVIPTDSTPITVAYHGTFDLTNTIVPQAMQHTYTYHVEWSLLVVGDVGRAVLEWPDLEPDELRQVDDHRQPARALARDPTGPDLKCTLRIVPQMGDFPDFSARYYADSGKIKIGGLEAPTHAVRQVLEHEEPDVRRRP